jgi:hypothetical protein
MKDEKDVFDGVTETEEDGGFIAGNVQVFDINDIDRIAVGRSGGSGLYGVAREVCDEIMAEAKKGKGVLVRQVVKAVRERLKDSGEEDPGYQPICVRLRNYVSSSKRYALKTNPNRVSFIVKK